jgi:hypothetical protein
MKRLALVVFALSLAPVAHADVAADLAGSEWQRGCRNVEEGSVSTIIRFGADGQGALEITSYSVPDCQPEGVSETVAFSYALSASETAGASSLDLINVADAEDRLYTIVGLVQDRLCFGLPTEALDGSAPDKRPDQLVPYEACYTPLAR